MPLIGVPTAQLKWACCLESLHKPVMLGAHPGIGHPIEDMPPELRDWFIPYGQSVYGVRYHFDGELVAILAVRHGKEAGY